MNVENARFRTANFISHALQMVELEKKSIDALILYHCNIGHSRAVYKWVRARGSEGNEVKKAVKDYLRVEGFSLNEDHIHSELTISW